MPLPGNRRQQCKYCLYFYYDDILHRVSSVKMKNSLYAALYRACSKFCQLHPPCVWSVGLCESVRVCVCVKRSHMHYEFLQVAILKNNHRIKINVSDIV